MEILPIFKSHFSIGRSILTLEKSGSTKPGLPRSIVDIAIENKLKNIILVEDSFGGFLEAYTNLKDVNINLIYGIRLTFTGDLTIKNEDSLKSNHKVVILARNADGYSRLIKIYSKAATDGFYYEPRMDFKYLKEVWSDKDLVLAIPFYDSFLFNNTLTTSICIPDFSFAEPVFFWEDNNLPVDEIIQNKLKAFTGKNNHELKRAQSIFYESRKNFKEFCVFKCINNRTTLNKPNLNGLSSNEFCFEKFKELSE